MTLTIHLPKQAEETLRQAFGDSLGQEAKEALAVEAYRRRKLSLGQFAELLGIDTYAADGLLKSRGITLDESLTQFDAELAALNRLANS